MESYFTPKKIVQYLDQFIIGQENTKKAVAVAMRNRWRRKYLPENIRKQITNKNILVSGPTGSGKTEIARRMAKLNNSPFIKVEATKFTQIGYQGGNVDSIIKDLAKKSLGQVTQMYADAKKQKVAKIENKVFEDLSNAMLGKDFQNKQIREKKINDLKAGKYKQLMMKIYPNEMQIGKNSPSDACITAEVQQIQHSLFEIYIQQYRTEIRQQDLQKQAVRRAQQYGIVFIDEIDKLVSPKYGYSQKQVSREGVQRDLLPMLQGTVINTHIGDIKTDNILFIACGAFSMCKVQDLMPELLGRLPIKVQMSLISQQEFKRILCEPKYNLLMQQVKLLQQQNIKLTYTPDSITQMAKFAYEMNVNLQNIGARRLQMITQKIVEDISFDSEKYKGQEFIIDARYVADKLKDIKKNFQYARYLI